MNPPFSFWLRVLAKAFLIMIINLAISFLEVYIYTLFVPGKTRKFYDAHALVSAPWVAAIAGGLLMFIFTRWYIKRNSHFNMTFALALPTAYTLIDLSILLALKVDFAGNYLILISAALAKYAGAVIALYITQKNHDSTNTSGSVF